MIKYNIMTKGGIVLKNKFIEKLPKLAISISIFTVLSLMVFLSVNKNSVPENTDATNQIKGVVTNYFNSEYESIKKGKAVNVDAIIGDEKLKEYVNLRNTREGLWYKKLNYGLTNYSIKINYSSINFNGTIYNIDITKDTTFSFDIDPDTVSKEWDVKHVITLKKTDNKWLIDSDKSDETSDLDEKISHLKEISKSIDTEINEYNDSLKTLDNPMKNK